LTTWILSLALHFQPWELSFVLIDFKGDGLSGALLELPHVAGVISNIHDISSIERNLASLEGELLRRQRVFAETKMENIHQYQEACRAGRVSEPVPYLIIVIDEFAELKTRHPEQMDKFISVARIGRSLGVYMVLATQSPGGGIVTGQVSANTRFRICLKTADAGESKDILGASDAFDLNVRGRAIVKVGNNEVYEKIQTFFSKAPYRPDEGTGVKIEVVELDGTRERPEAYEKTAPAQGTDFSQARAVANYIIETARRAGAPKARQVLLPPLPETLYLSGLLNGYAAAPGGLALPAGLVDDPEGQRQYPFVLDFARQGHHLFYGAPGTGKTNLLRTALVATARLYPPELAQFAVLDFGAWGLKLFERLSRCRCYASEQDGVAEAESFLKSEIDRRKRAFAEQGVGRLEDYREITGEAMPWILVTIDNLAALHNAHPDFLDTLLVAARDGAALGIGLLMTTGGGGAFLYRMQNYIQNIHCLRLTDKSEYRQHVGGGGRREPGDFPGRGFTKGPLEFQAALFMDGATEAERIKNLRVLCESQQPAAPSRERAPLTRCEEYIQLGYDEKGGPVAFYFNDMSGCVFVNNGLLEAVTRALPGRVVSDDFDAQIGEIAAEYNRRGEGERSGPPMYICIKDYPAFFEAADNETVARLDLLVRYGENCGIYVYIAGKAEQLSRFAQLKEPLFHSCLLSGNAVVAGHCDFIETPILGKNEVYLLHDGVKTRMEVPHA
ncbi:MAG: FtsK/SpoIIIE domain-containing protein, partial [Firmicutes bacterium]|nr:FtsK/SpoIIIE domain-containing protein [Bacillota bacterium]